MELLTFLCVEHFGGCIKIYISFLFTDGDYSTD